MSGDRISEAQLYARHDPVRGAVLIIGVGAVGGFLAEELAPMGISPLRLVDPDTLAAQNLVRHPLSRTSIGKPKATSLADKIRGGFPDCDVAGINEDFLALTASEQFQLVSQAHVVVVSADSEACRRRVTRFASKLRYLLYTQPFGLVTKSGTLRLAKYTGPCRDDIRLVICAGSNRSVTTMRVRPERVMACAPTLKFLF